jgi:hypothetical protein
MLYRAFAYICRRDQPEVTVFFEDSAGSPSPVQTLLNILAAQWRVPLASIEAYNCFDECELLGDHAYGPASTGDARLLEIGTGGADQIHYAKPETTTLLLVSPITLARLVAAQQLAARLQRFHRTSRGKGTLERHWTELRRAA